MRVVVIGATGNLGASVLEVLGSDPSVTSILGVARRVPETPLPKVEWAAADITTTPLEPLLDGSQAVVHLAWVIQPSHQLDRLEAINVTGSERIFEAAAAAGVGAIVYASSVGAYSPGPKDRRVDESWPTEGIPSSFYSRHKAAVERRLDRFEADHPAMRVVRLRPGLIFKRPAGTRVRRLFLGRFFPPWLLAPERIPVIPRMDSLIFQAVHASDVAQAVHHAVTGTASGAFNLAADPVLDPPTLASAVGARLVPVPARLARPFVELSWRSRLQPTPPGWLDMALTAPLLDTTKARRVLGWVPQHTSTSALREVLRGMADRAEGATPALARDPEHPPGSSGPPEKAPEADHP